MSNTFKLKTIKPLFLVALTALYTADVLAITASARGPVSDLITFLKESIAQNVAAVAIWCCLIIALIIVVMNKVGDVFKSFLAKSCFFGFGITGAGWLCSSLGTMIQ